MKEPPLYLRHYADNSIYERFVGKGDQCQFTEWTQCRNRAFWKVGPDVLCAYHKSFVIDSSEDMPRLEFIA